jgi:hypothetical protein
VSGCWCDAEISAGLGARELGPTIAATMPA